MWPHYQGKQQGLTLLPLYEKLPLAALKDKDLYEMLTFMKSDRLAKRLDQ